MALKYNAQKAHEEYEFFKARGICTVCRKRRAFDGHTRCAECIERQTLRDAERYANRHNAEMCRKRYYRHKSTGMCVECGQPADAGNVRCAKCRALNIARLRRNRVSVRKPEGVCWRKNCNEPTVNGTRCCERHLQEMRDHAQMMRDTAHERGTWKGWDNRWIFVKRGEA